MFASRSFLALTLLCAAPCAAPLAAQVTVPSPDSAQPAPQQQPQQAPAPVVRAAPDSDQQAQPTAQPAPEQQAAPQPPPAAAETNTPPESQTAPLAHMDSKPPKPTGVARTAGQGDNDQPIRADQIKNPVLWHDPGNISSLDLFNGQGGEKGMPQPPFTFNEEDMNGTNPKFDATDAKDRKWRVKLGNESRPEVVASRLLWAMGFYVNDDYVIADAHVDNLNLKRGGNLAKNGTIHDARFSRKPAGEKKIGIWEWKQNPFNGTREFNGLRVMMAVMNSWDLKDVNNAVYKEKGSDNQFFLVSDIGATFATTDFSLTKGRSKGNAKQYEKSKFITRASDTEVDFANPSKPTGLLLMSMGIKADDFAMRSSLVWIGKNIPRADAKWMGSLLGQLTHEQIVDAFRAGHFPPSDIDTYVRIVEDRIAELKSL